MRRMLKRPLSESAVVKSEAQWSMDDNVVGRPVWNRTFLILTDDERSKWRGMRWRFYMRDMKVFRIGEL